MKLSFIKQGFKSLSIGLLSAVALVTLTGGSAQAIQIPYEDIGSTSIETPVFNTYTNVPNYVGNEADFVRIRPSTGDVADNGVNGARNVLYVNGHEAACAVGDKFDVRTYIHNGADDDFNDNGNGSAVAHGTNVRMVAPLNAAGKNFTFTSSISATDVSPVSDTARLYCETEDDVMLKLVPQSVKVYSSQYGFQSVADSAVNGTLPIGSRVAGSGDVWGCWADRVTVAYIVEVVEIPQEEPEVPAYTCDLLTLTALGNRKYRYTATATGINGAVVKEYRFNFKDGSDVLVTTDKTVEHTYAKEGTYKPFVEVVFTVTHADGSVTTETVTDADCAQELKIEKTVEPCPVPGKGHLPKNSPDCKVVTTPPTTLPNTGAGGAIAGIMTAVASIGAVAHRKLTLKRQ